MDFAKAFSFVFDDQDWVQKIIIGGLVSLVPIVGWLLVMGYMIAVGRNVIRGNPRPLPDWSDFGQMIVDGLYVFVISFVYTLPIFIGMCAVLPMLAIGGAFSGNGELGAIGILGICGFIPLALIYGLVVGWFFLPAALARYADTGDMMSALRFGEIWAIGRANPIAFLIALLLTWIATSIVAPAGVIACVIGVLFTSFYSQCVIGHAYGQAYLAATEGAAYTDQ